MTAITYLDRNESGSVSCLATQPVTHPVERVDKLNPSRGLVLGLTISLGFWVVVGIGAFLVFGL